MNPWTNQSTNESVKQCTLTQGISASSTQWVSESTNQWIDESVDQWTNEQVDQSLKQWVNESLIHGISESNNQWINKAMNQKVNQSKSMNQRIHESTNQRINKERMNELKDGMKDGWMSELLCWATSSLSDLFAEAPLLSATFSPSSHLFGLPLPYSASQLALL